MNTSTTAAPAATTPAVPASPVSFMNGGSFDANSGKALNPTAQTDLSKLGAQGNSYTGYIAPQPISNPTSSPSTSASTTTISNQNKINQVPGIINTTNNLSKTGISTDQNGNPIYSNGTFVPQNDDTASAAPNLSNGGVSQGGYVGDVYYAPGAQLPVGQDGKPVQITPNSPTDDQIISSLNAQKSQSDALTATVIDSIHSQYAQLRQQQEQASQGAQASTNNALLMGGVTGQGSSAQFAPVSSAGIMQAQVSYGIQQIADLNNKEQTAVIAAQQAGQNADFQLQDKINQQISNIRDTKVAAATKLNDQLQAQNQKLADAKLQATKDSAVADLYSQGITDPTEIMKELNAQGLVINSTEVGDAIKNITPDAAALSNVALQAAQAGATPEVMAAIQNAKSLPDAIAAAAPALGLAATQKIQQQAFDNNVTLQQLAISKANEAISAENAGTQRASLQLQMQELQDQESPASIMQYAQAYQSSGVIPSDAPKGASGAIAAIASTLPKIPGTIYDPRTGVAPTKLDPNQENNVSQLYNIINNVLPQLSQTFSQGAFGPFAHESGDYLNAASSLKDALAVLGSSGILKSGTTNLTKLIPSTGTVLTSSGKAGIANLTNTLTQELNSYLATNSLSIAGYSDKNNSSENNAAANYDK